MKKENENPKSKEKALKINGTLDDVLKVSVPESKEAKKEK